MKKAFLTYFLTQVPTSVTCSNDDTKPIFSSVSNSDFVINCSVSAYSKYSFPNIIWTFNTTLMQITDLINNTEDKTNKTSQLKIVSPKRTDSGIYSLAIKENSRADIIKNFRITFQCK
jgi:hypothetical protein